MVFITKVGWGVAINATVEVGWGIFDEIRIFVTLGNSTDVAKEELADQVWNICYGGAVVYSSKNLIKNLIVDATPNLLL